MLVPFFAAAVVELSTIVVPIHASLAPLLPALESQVPKSQIKVDAYEMDPKQQYGMKYRVQRDPIALTMIGTGIHASTTVHYSMEVCRRTVKPIIGTVVMWPCISCGFSEPMREAYIAIDSHLSWDADWRLASPTTARPAGAPRRRRGQRHPRAVPRRVAVPGGEPPLHRELRAAALSGPHRRHDPPLPRQGRQARRGSRRRLPRLGAAQVSRTGTARG